MSLFDRHKENSDNCVIQVGTSFVASRQESNSVEGLPFMWMNTHRHIISDGRVKIGRFRAGQLWSCTPFLYSGIII